jgi:hypothetical protein
MHVLICTHNATDGATGEKCRITAKNVCLL